MWASAAQLMSQQETIELGGSELGGFLGGSLPPPFPPLRASFFLNCCLNFFTLVFSSIFLLSPI
jgi:hypothetical protein